MKSPSFGGESLTVLHDVIMPSDKIVQESNHSRSSWRKRFLDSDLEHYKVEPPYIK